MEPLLIQINEEGQLKKVERISCNVKLWTFYIYIIEFLTILNIIF